MGRFEVKSYTGVTPVLPSVRRLFHFRFGPTPQLFGRQEQARLPQRHQITADKTEGKTELKTLLAAAIAVTFALPAHAEEKVSFVWIKVLPFVKAAAYAEAIDDYCFVDKRYSFDPIELDLDDPRRELETMAYRQAKAGRLAFNGEFVEDDKEIRKEADLKAAAHLQNNYSACAPAIAFVENTIASIPAMKPKLLSMAEKLDANRREAKSEALNCKVCAGTTPGTTSVP